MHIILLSFVLIQAVLAASNLEVCQKKLETFNKEREKVPKNEVGDLASLKVQLSYCEDWLKCAEGLKDQITPDKLKYIKTTCDSLRFLAGPYNQCPEKLNATATKADCTTWAITLDQSKYYLPNKEQCDGFKQRKDCIHKDVLKICGTEAAKSFQENTGFLETMVGCV